jgi:hypothetical protein
VESDYPQPDAIKDADVGLADHVVRIRGVGAGQR